MNLLQVKTGKSGRGTFGAFTLTEVLVSVAVCSFVFVSLYAGIAQSTTSLQRARERLRGTQILTEKLEVVRLYNWDQVNTAGYIPTSFSDYQYPSSDTNQPGKGVRYTGTIAIGAADVHPAYTNTMRKLVASVSWVSAGITNTQRMETLISEFGVQRYVY
ncbi:MAG TPA: hypothetical protein VM735_01260 [Candidatus Kapabacteria bacterium]|nr:hypothetical protein [Candidatus Kapabacteria bacterium]